MKSPRRFCGRVACKINRNNGLESSYTTFFGTGFGSRTEDLMRVKDPLTIRHQDQVPTMIYDQVRAEDTCVFEDLVPNPSSVLSLI